MILACHHTWTEVVAHVKRTQHAVRDVKVRVHLQLGHLAGELQKRFRVHRGRFSFSFFFFNFTSKPVAPTMLLSRRGSSGRCASSGFPKGSAAAGEKAAGPAGKCQCTAADRAG